MHKHFLSFVRVFSAFMAILGLCAIGNRLVVAEPVASVLISRLQVRELPTDSSTNSYNEFVEIANNSPEAVDISGWCLKYAGVSSPDNLKTLGCFMAAGTNAHVLLPSYGRAFVASQEYLDAHYQMMGYDFIFKATLSNEAGYVKLFDDTNTEVDAVSWGAGANSMNGGQVVDGYVFERIELGNGQLQQTGRPVDDFRLAFPRAGYVSSAQHVFDLCLNLAGIQTEVPPGLSSDEKGNCSPPPVDVCLNIDGVQSTLPQGDTADAAGNCYPSDDEVPGELPPTVHPPQPIELSEVLPNPGGADAGNEFIEIHNPNEEAINLDDYQLFVGADLVTNFTNQIIEGNDYLVLTNANYDFTLVNTSGQVMLLLGGSLIDQASYATPKDGWSWAKIDGAWQYTNRVTPGLVNESAVLLDDGGNGTTVSLASNLQTCAEGQERNPATNRCRKIVLVESPAPCPASQYRNPDTGRCKSLAVDTNTLTPCAPDEERNPDTNRCRKLVSATSEATPCKAGQERNPDTNRCRNVQAMATADYAVAGVRTQKDAGAKFIWWVIGSVMVAAAAYAIYEWRAEIIKLCRRVVAWQWRRK